ncbi:carboxymuconolactone decarboxylase family protein [Arhodomonas sp. AD133]|uniref:carboxymuconolactone decarboxylase family protein n=1 Tax=Arhodomonas sp. AD133 TaxID=3415009 RepID=UPI003EB75844
MQSRLDYFAAAPKTMQGMVAFEQHIQGCGLEHSLMELVKTRASQINGCAYCIHMHTRDARAAGETEERLYLVSAWAESPLYTPRERAALAWTDALTRIAESHPSDALYEDVSAQFTEEELVALTLLIGGINVWNRINVGFHGVHPHEQTDNAAMAEG